MSTTNLCAVTATSEERKTSVYYINDFFFCFVFQFRGGGVKNKCMPITDQINEEIKNKLTEHSRRQVIAALNTNVPFTNVTLSF